MSLSFLESNKKGASLTGHAHSQWILRAPDGALTYLPVAGFELLPAAFGVFRSSSQRGRTSRWSCTPRLIIVPRSGPGCPLPRSSHPTALHPC